VPKLFSEWSCHDLFLLRLLVGSESLRNRSWTMSGDHAELVGVMGVESVCVVFIIKQSTTEKLPALAAPKSSCLCFVSPVHTLLPRRSSPAIFATSLSEHHYVCC
jgi:hypothetical protein